MKSLKQRTMSLGTALTAAFLIASALLSPAADVSSDAASLQAEILRIAAPIGGELGVAAWAARRPWAACVGARRRTVSDGKHL